MPNETAILRYSAPRRLLHWSMAILLIAAVIGVEMHDFFPKDSSLRGLLMTVVHFQFGLLVFILVWPRILLNLHGKPPITPPLVPWQRAISSATHGMLYIVMIAMPILGVLLVQTGGHAVSLLGVPLPQLIGADKELSKQLHEIHSTLGNIAIALVTLHFAAAIWHHWVVKDDTLTRMLPPRKG